MDRAYIYGMHNEYNLLRRQYHYCVGACIYPSISAVSVFHIPLHAAFLEHVLSRWWQGNISAATTFYWAISTYFYIAVSTVWCTLTSKWVLLFYIFHTATGTSALYKCWCIRVPGRKVCYLCCYIKSLLCAADAKSSATALDKHPCSTNSP